MRVNAIGPASHGGAPRGWLDLSVNLNPLGTPGAVRAAVERARYETYADLDAEPAVARLARDSGVDASRVVVTAGATEAIRLVIGGLLQPGGRLLVVGPTFAEYGRRGWLAGARIREVRAAAPDFEPPVDEAVAAIRAFRPHVVAVCDPNNPTGRSIGGDCWKVLLDAATDCHFLVDESFAPFREPGRGVRLDDPRVIVVRSLTKLLAIPGIRVGFLIAAAEVAARLRLLADPWSVGSHAIAAASAGGWGLDDGSRQTVAAWRVESIGALRARGLVAVPSDVNFHLVAVSGSTDGLVAALAEQRIAVRSVTNFGIAGMVRIAVPAPDGLARLARALDVAWLVA